MMNLVPKNVNKLLQEKPTVKRSLVSPQNSFGRIKVPELRNLSTIIHNKPDLYIERSRHSSLGRDRGRSNNMTDHSANDFFDMHSQKNDDEANTQLMVHLKIQGIHGDFALGDETHLKLAVDKINSEINHTNGVLKALNVCINNFKFEAGNCLKLVIADNSGRSHKALEIDYRYLIDEDHNYTQTQLDLNIQDIEGEFVGTNLKRTSKDINKVMELYQRHSVKNKSTETRPEAAKLEQKRIKEFKKAEVSVNMIRFKLLTSSTSSGLQITIDSNKTEINTSEYLEIQNT